MYRILAIACREFTAMVVTKAFVFTLVLMPILMFGGIVLLPTIQKLNGQKERRIVVADGSGKLFDSIKEAANQRNRAILDAIQVNQEAGDIRGSDPFVGVEILNLEASEQPELTDSQRLSLSKRIREGDLYAFVEIPADFAEVESSAQARFVMRFAH